MYWAKGKQDFERSRISSRMLGTLQFQMFSGVFVAKLEILGFSTQFWCLSLWTLLSPMGWRTYLKRVSAGW